MLTFERFLYGFTTCRNAFDCWKWMMTHPYSEVTSSDGFSYLDAYILFWNVWL